MVKGVLFDMDGTMLDTEPVSESCWKQSALDCGFVVDDTRMRSLYGKNIAAIKKIVCEDWGKEDVVEEFVAGREKYYRQFLREGTLVKKKGLMEILTYLKLQKIPMAVCTSTEKEAGEMALKKAGIYEYFDGFVYGDTVTRTKPDPQGYQIAAEMLGLSPKECLVVEDSLNGVLAGKNAGGYIIYVPDIVEVPDEVKEGITAEKEDLLGVLEWLQVQKLQEIIDDSTNIVFFGGAGVSTESNIPDFRSADGLYQQQYKYSPEQIVSHSFFKRHTEAFYEFYKEKMMFLDAKPNKAHKKLADLETAGKLRAIVTQNIDGLHQAAGSKTVYELHGSIHRNYCQRCMEFYDSAYVKKAAGIPKCKCGGIIKPDVVLYEEGLDSRIIENSIRAISEADTLIIGGTSLVVYPAAGFIDYFRGKHLVVINKSETAKSVGAELTISAPIGEILEQIIV